MPTFHRFAALIALNAFPCVIVAQIQPASALDEVFATYCASCHGRTMQGGSGPNLLEAINVRQRTDAELTATIRDGVATSGMPAWKSVIEDSRIRGLVLLIREQAARALRGETPPSTPLEGVAETALHRIALEIWRRDLDEPWGLAFLPDGGCLVTEKKGRLLQLDAEGATAREITGIPADLDIKNQAGLFDVALAPDYGRSGWVYLAYAQLITGEDGKLRSQTRVVRGRIHAGVWQEETAIFTASRDSYGPAGHSNFGGRLFFARDGSLLLTVGDGRVAENAQLLHHPSGKVHRLRLDGSAPPDNPFFGDPAALPTIYSVGHRNMQGIAEDPATGALFLSEHGPRGGDEINLLAPGRNYGWPLATYGMEYDGTSITPFTRVVGTEAPLAHWEPSIAPSGLLFYTGEEFPRWRGHLVLGSLAAEQLRLLNLSAGRITSQEILFPRIGRIRQVAQDRQGRIYLLIPKAIVRLRNAESPSSRP